MFDLKFVSFYVLQFLSLDGCSLSTDDLIKLGKAEYKIKVWDNPLEYT